MHVQTSGAIKSPQQRATSTKCRDPATMWRDTCTASHCEQAAIECCFRFSTQKFLRTQREPRDTRHPACAPHEKPLSASFLHRIWQDRHPSRDQGPLGAFSRAQKALSLPMASSQKKYTARVCKHCHNLSYGLPTADWGWRLPSLETLTGCKRKSIHKVARGGRNSLRMTYLECESSRNKYKLHRR